MRALALTAVLVLAGCTTTVGGVGGGPPPQEALTIGFLQTSSLPRASSGAASDPSYSSGVTISCTVGGYVAFRADVGASADASPVRLAIARVDAAGNESIVGSPAPITVAASEPPPSAGVDEFIYEPMSVAQLCTTLGAGNYHGSVLAADGTVLASGHFSIAP